MKTTAGLATILAAAVAAQTAAITMETVEYKGWKDNLKLVNQQMELIVTLDAGPRVIFLGLVGDLAPGRSVEHVKQWYLFTGVPRVASGDEAALEQRVRPLVERLK